MQGRCDFCSTDEPAWVVPTRTFETLPGYQSNGDWAACDACVKFVRARNWDGLIDRVLSCGTYENTAALRPGLKMLYGNLQRSLVGGPRKL